MALAAFSYCMGYRTHGKTVLLLILYICTGMMAAGKLWLGLWFAVPGALGLALGHLLNRKLCKYCVDCENSRHNIE